MHSVNLSSIYLQISWPSSCTQTNYMYIFFFVPCIFKSSTLLAFCHFFFLFFFQVGKNKHHKSHHFDVSNDVAMHVGHEKPGIGGEPLRGQKMKPRNSAFPRGEGSNLPAWVAFDRQVLCFDAYFQEAVYEKREEQYRVRNCKIYFYLEDDSLQVIEPRSKNSGVPQGNCLSVSRY